MSSTPACYDGDLIFATSAGSLVSLDAADATLNWRIAIGPQASPSSPAVASGVIYLGTNGVLAAYTVRGALLWDYPAGAGVETSPAVARGVVYAADLDGDVFALRARTGAELWSHRDTSFSAGTLAVADGVLFATGAYDVVAYDAESGALLWSGALRGYSSSISVADGAVYPVGGSLYAFTPNGQTVTTATRPAVSSLRVGQTGAMASVAIVTGAGGPDGIGFACARRLVEAGHRVVVAATTDRIHERAAELGSVGFVGDLTDPSTADDLVALAARQGDLEVLVNNAGMTSLSDPDQPGRIDELADAPWHTSVARNLDSVFFMTRAAVRVMRPKKYGRIVTVGSVSGPVVAFPNDAAYHAAKAGVLGLTRSAALDTAADGITVNIVAPGWIDTGHPTAGDRVHGVATPAGRSGTPDEIASLVAYLASRDAGYLTGQLIVVDGGNSIVEAHGRS